MKIKKRLAAIGVAVMMTFSTAAINASAAYQNYTVNASHSSVPFYFKTTQFGKYTVNLRIGSISDNSTVTCTGYVYVNNVWATIVILNKSSIGESSKYGTSNQIYPEFDGRNIISISPTNGTSVGATNGY